MSPQKFADKYLLAVEQAMKEKPSGGLNGFEQEWNLLDEDLRPCSPWGQVPARIPLSIICVWNASRSGRPSSASSKSSTG